MGNEQLWEWCSGKRRRSWGCARRKEELVEWAAVLASKLMD